MKLTVKVEKRDKVRAFVRDFEDYGCINRPFDTEDFVELENAVILTVEEVFTLKQMVQWVMKSSRLNNMNKVFLEKTYNFLNERFEKAEKGNETK